MESVVKDVKTRNIGYMAEMNRLKKEMFYKKTDGLTEEIKKRLPNMMNEVAKKLLYEEGEKLK